VRQARFSFLLYAVQRGPTEARSGILSRDNQEVFETELGGRFLLRLCFSVNRGGEQQ
jgi:hypothetical protein